MNDLRLLEARDADFKANLKTGYDFQMFIGREFLERNFIVWVPELNFYTGPDSGDIFLRINQEWKIIEVKSREYKFTNNEDFPFESIIVDQCSNWDNKKHSPVAAVHVSQLTLGKFAILLTKDCLGEWWKEKKEDSKKGNRNIECYYMKKSSNHVISWEQLISKLGGKTWSTSQSSK